MRIISGYVGIISRLCEDIGGLGVRTRERLKRSRN